MSTTVKSIQLEQLDSRVKSVWRRAQTLHLTAGGLAMLRWAVPLFLVAVAADWLLDIPPVGRVVILVALVAARSSAPG